MKREQSEQSVGGSGSGQVVQRASRERVGIWRPEQVVWWHSMHVVRRGAGEEEPFAEEGRIG